jgi:hypothetical protein
MGTELTMLIVELFTEMPMAVDETSKGIVQGGGLAFG